ncbi:MAG: Holliday junction branch migration protein RuvA [Saprospiraceae bacterium]|nr:Holliday junction branch migration protein RuvA [Saprospiraceae bacterium]MBK7465922.1 Holliday junction branch migration protein RuvA [Saprospiraceae bacterium]MBK9992621.1 Holliday junction branch migration protein RuvA [Saprospiraceae bacterium]
MYEYIKGSIIQRQPTHLVVETGGIGYHISISLHSFTQLDGVKEATILTHLIVKEDSHTLFGFTTEEERFLFIQLISVNGVGPNTARLILSSLEPVSIRSAIINGDDLMFKKVKGVGPKTAQRIIIDLRDKMAKDLPSLDSKDNKSTAYHLKNEAISALIALGFGRPQIEQVFKNIPELSDPSTPIEDLIKIALKKLA